LRDFECDYVSGRPKAVGCDAFRWVRPERLEQYPFPRANQKIIAALRQRLGAS